MPDLAKARPLIPSHSLIVGASSDCDAMGHDAGPDTFQPQVDRRASASVHCTA